MTGHDGSFDAATSSLSALIAGFVTFRQLKGLDKISKSVDSVGTSLIAVKDIVDDVASGKAAKKLTLGAAIEASNKRIKEKIKAYRTNLEAFEQAKQALADAKANNDLDAARQLIPATSTVAGKTSNAKKDLQDELITRQSLREQLAKLNGDTQLLGTSTSKTTEATTKAAAATDKLAQSSTNLGRARNTLIVSDSMSAKGLETLNALIDVNLAKYDKVAQSMAAQKAAGDKTVKLMSQGQVAANALSDSLSVAGAAYGNYNKSTSEATKGTKRFYESQNGWIRNAGSTRNIANDAGNAIKNYGKRMKEAGGITGAVKTVTMDTAAAVANMGSAVVNCGIAIKDFCAVRLAAAKTALITCFTNPVIAATIAVTALVAATVYGLAKVYNQAKKKKYYTMLEDRIDTEGVDRNDPVIQDMLAKAKRQEEMDEAIDAANKEAAQMMEDYGKTIDARIDAAKKAAEMAQIGTTPGGTTTDTSPQGMSQDDYAAKMAAATQEAARYRLEQENKLAEARKAAEIAYAEKVVSLLEQLGAKDAAYNKRKILNSLKADEEILKNTNVFAQTKLAAEQELANKRLKLSKSTDAKAREILEKEIALADQKIKDLIANHKNDIIEIKIKAAVNQMDEDLNKKIEDLGKERTYKEDGRAGDILKSGEAAYNQAQSTTLSNYSNQAQTLATANANGDANTIMSIGQLLGLGAEEIQARGQAISDMYNVVSQALITATANEVDANNQAMTATTEHANAVRKLHDYVEDYKVSVGKDVGNMFAAWISGAKSASEALKDFASGLINNAVQIMAQWLGVYAILLACGSNPHAASKGASKAVLGIDGKKDGGLIIGPGSSRSDSIPTMLSNGEYVINARAVDAIGLSNLDALNRGYIPHFADGGLVGDNNNAAPVSHNNSVSLNVNAIDSSSFEDFLRRGGLDKIKQAIYSDNRNFASNVGVF